jgi:hypothetical protein
MENPELDCMNEDRRLQPRKSHFPGNTKPQDVGYEKDPLAANAHQRVLK